MLFTRAVLASAALFASRALAGGDHYETETSTECESETATHGSYVTTTHTTKTDYATTTHLVEIDSTVTSVHTQVVESYVTECITTTLYYTDLVTKTKTNTETDVAYLTKTLISNVTTTNTDTDTDTAYVTNTLTDSTTLTDTESVTITGTAYETVTTTNTVPTEVTTTGTVPTTTYTTTTIFSTSFNPCPTECSVSAETVNLYFWPSDRPHSYPTTWVDESLDYTFTYPSVYMLVPTAAGVNNASQTVGPKTTDWVIALDLTEVSTIVSSTATVQLQLSDLHTDCPKSVAPGAIATMATDPHCNPILAAPSEVKSWAYPCNACGQFGLFDPPYAAPTLTGPLVIPTTTVATTGTTEEPSSTVVVVPTATETETATTEDPTDVTSTLVVIPPVTSASLIPLPSISDISPAPMPTVSEVPPEPLPTVSELPPVSMPTVSEIPPVSMPTVSTEVPPVSMPTVSTEVPPVSMPTVTESTSQPIPTAAGTDLRVAMGSLFSVFLMALAL